MNALLRSEGLRFVVLGAAIFAAYGWWGASSPRIHVSAAKQAQIAHGFELEQGRSPSPGELESLVQRWITEEALVLEARRIGLTERDVVIRKRLIQDMELMLESEANVQPDDATLQAFYRTHTERYRLPATLTLEYIYLAAGSDPDGTRRAAIEAALASGEPTDRLGDPTAHGSPLPGLTRRRLEALLGEDIATAASEIKDDAWHGPVSGHLGLHWLRTPKRTASRLPPLEEVRKKLVDLYAQEARERAITEGKQRLRSEFEVVVESAP